jgi:hypothetical protein
LRADYAGEVLSEVVESVIHYDDRLTAAVSIESWDTRMVQMWHAPFPLTEDGATRAAAVIRNHVAVKPEQAQ